MKEKPRPTILTLDAGGTNFVFSAIRDYAQIADPVSYPAYGDDLNKCLKNIVDGFAKVAEAVSSFDAISFAFPGPADYDLGIIGDLPNFRAFNGGVALGPMLEQRFDVPVFINNDGNLFASGVSKAGYLPWLNQQLEQAASRKRYKNVIGITLGTGFGCGIVCNGQLITGDNSCGGEIHNTLNGVHAEWNAEESVSTRAIQRVYAEQSGIRVNDKLLPGEIYNIAKGKWDGNAEAAMTAFVQYGEALGLSIANVLTLIDGIVVIGGGISAAWDLFAPAMFKSINKPFQAPSGQTNPRLSYKVFNLEDKREFTEFIMGAPRRIHVPGSDTIVEYDRVQRSGVALSNINASLAISLGAYDFALQKLNHEK